MFCPSCKKLMRPRPSYGAWVCQKCGTSRPFQDARTDLPQDAGRGTLATAPFQYRPGQEELKHEILKEVENGTRVVLLEAPVGAGKSLILAEVAEALHRERGWTGYYTTPQVTLVEQLRHSRLVSDKVQPIVGTANYPCAIDRAPEGQRRMVSEAWCIPANGKPCERCQARGTLPNTEPPLRCPVCQGRKVVKFTCPERYKTCQYFIDRKKAAKGALATMTLAYLLRVTRNPPDSGEAATEEPVDVEEPPRFLSRDFLIVDEAHGLGEYSSFLSIRVSEQSLDSSVWKAAWKNEWGKSVGSPDDPFRDMDTKEIRALVTRLREVVWSVMDAEKAPEARGTKEDLSRIRRLNHAEQLEDNLTEALEDLDTGNRWVAQVKEDKPQETQLELTPVLSQKMLSRRLWPLGPKLVILSTATILDPHQFLSEVGLPDQGVRHFAPPSTFPADNGPIFASPAVNMSSRYQERNYPAALEHLQRIMDRHADQRGVIHVAGYEMQGRIANSLPEPYRSRFVTHDRGKSRNRTLSSWERSTSQNTVLLAVAMEEGLDLKGQLAEWQVIFKCPYAGLNDRRVTVRKQLPDGERWYKLLALRRLLQSFGRIVRSETDVGWTYILDSSAVDLLDDHWDMLPSWAQERLRAGRRAAELGFQFPRSTNSAR